MLNEKEYRREAALQYAKQWALGRNPRYLDFEHMGGDCTNFASQCIYAGSWYYHSPVIVAVENGRIFLAAHSYDAYMRPLDSYQYEQARFLHIKEVRVWGT